LDVKLLSGNLPAKATNYRSHVAEGLADNLPQIMKKEKHSGNNLFSKLVSDKKKNDVLYRYRQIVVKQIVKRHSVVIILKNVN
jgi:hypothetical protein